jgi:hypothetical protein
VEINSLKMKCAVLLPKPKRSPAARKHSGLANTHKENNIVFSKGIFFSGILFKLAVLTTIC